MTNHRVSSLFVVVLLTSALFVSISSIVVPPEAHAAALTVILGPGPTGKAGDIISVNTAIATPPDSAGGTVCSITGSVPGLVTPVSGTAATAVVTWVAGVKHVIGSFKVGTVAGPAGAGTYSVIVTCPSTGSMVDQGTRVFTLNPSITLSAPVVVAGQVVSVTGVGFKSDETGCDTTGLAIIDGTGWIVDLTTVSCSITGGSMSGSFTVNSLGAPPIPDTITVTSASLATASTGITKVSSPTIIVTPVTVPQGSTPSTGCRLRARSSA